MLNPKNLKPGEDQYEAFTPSLTRTGVPNRERRTYVQYDYRHTDGELFSAVDTSLDRCITRRDEWIAKKAQTTTAL
jgi:hypothetical protein